MSLDRIHPVLITRDAAATIERTLSSLSAFPDVLVYDNGSTDATLDICRRHSNVRIETGEFFGFGRTKAHAVSLARGDWVFSIDADEYLSPELLESLAAANLEDPRVAYALERGNLFMGKHVTHGGWGDDWIVRIFDRRECQFSDRSVHEKVVVPDGVRVERLDGMLWHQTVTDVGQFLTKINRYSDLALLRDRPVRSPPVIAIMTIWSTLKSYLIKGGFLEGWRGLVIAYCDGVGVFFRYIKRYAKAKKSESEASGADQASARDSGNARISK